jgi:hypothetical protein
MLYRMALMMGYEDRIYHGADKSICLGFVKTY